MRKRTKQTLNNPKQQTAPKHIHNTYQPVTQRLYLEEKEWFRQPQQCSRLRNLVVCPILVNQQGNRIVE
jgi:hypothetical protein